MLLYVTSDESNLDSHCLNGQQRDASLILFCESLQKISLLGSCRFNDKLD